MSADYYSTIEDTGYAEFRDRGSRFLAYAFPIGTVEAFKKRLNELKEEHPKAVHHCFGYRIGTDGANFRSSDDGEPSGTAGKPILGQIDSKQLTNLAVVVVRYFGGTLLGVPGLINAYKTVTALALQTAIVVQRAVEVNYKLQFDYTKMNDVMVIIKKYSCTIISQELHLFCVMRIGIPRSSLELVLLKFNEMYGVEIEKL